MIIKNKTYSEDECGCPVCIAMCRDIRPCWGTPQEIEAIIARGMGKRLMLTYWQESGNKPIQMLSPAFSGYENEFAPILPSGRCTFLNSENQCQLHELNLKPAEGRSASCKNEKPSGIAPEIAKLWLSDEGLRIILEWHKSKENV